MWCIIFKGFGRHLVDKHSSALVFAAFIIHNFTFVSGKISMTTSAGVIGSSRGHISLLLSRPRVLALTSSLLFFFVLFFLDMVAK